MQAMTLNGCLQIVSGLLMAGLAAWLRGWCRKQLKEPDDGVGEERVQSMPLVGPAAALAAAVADEEPAGSIPEVEVVELSHTCISESELHKRKSVEVV